jgi:DNA-binding NarL/FixJ family response regulator
VFGAGASTLLTAAGFDPVLLARPGDGVAAQVRARRCSALILDDRFGARPYAADVVGEVAASSPDVAIVVVVRRAQPAGIVAAMEAGAGALTNRGCTPEELIAAVEAAISGQNWVAPALAGVLRGELLSEMSGQRRPELSPREREVLRELATGATNSQIGEHLGISQNTVRNHVQSIMRKLGVGTRTDAVATALRQGLVDLPG